MDTWIKNLIGSVLVGAAYTLWVPIPDHDAHVLAYYAHMDRNFQEQWAKRPRQKPRPFNRT